MAQTAEAQERAFRSALVGLCQDPECGVYMEPYQRQEECPMGCVGEKGYKYLLLKKRRLLVCSHCEAALIPKTAERHNCDDYDH